MDQVTVTTHGVEQLVDAVEEVLRSETVIGGRPATAAFRRLRSAVKDALSDPELLPASLTAGVRLPPTGVAKYRLHRCDSFVLFATLTAPGSVLPAHDHGSWGLVGMYRGIEEEILYVPVDSTGGYGGGAGSGGAGSGGAAAGGAASPLVALAEARRVVHTAGSISIISPPLVDIHRLVNLGDENSISIHLFGDDVVAKGFRSYAPAHTVIESGPLDYDEIPPCPPS